MSDRARVNIFISEELKAWYKKRAKETGLSMSAMMAFVLQEYKDTKDREEKVYGWFDHKEREDIGKVVRKVIDKVIEKKEEELVEQLVNGKLDEVIDENFSNDDN